MAFYCMSDIARPRVFPEQLKKGNCVKIVRIWSFSGPYFPTFALNTEKYRVSLRIKSKCGKIRTRKTPNTDTFQVVGII